MRTNILVASHPRSGTHLLIDLVRNNFSEFRLPYISLFDVERRSGLRNRLSLLHRVRTSTRICKTHSVPIDLEIAAQGDEIVEHILRTCRVFYIARDGRDVLTSQYLRLLAEGSSPPPFSDYLRQRVRCRDSWVSRPRAWAMHLAAWNEDESRDLSFFRFEKVLSDPMETVRRISEIMAIDPRCRFADVRLQSSDGPSPPRYHNRHVTCKRIERTSIFFRGGRVGDYQTCFSQNDGSFFAAECEDVPIALELIGCKS